MDTDVNTPKPVRVQLKRTKGWRMPPNTVKVDRTTRWGNPFIVEKERGERWSEERPVWRKTWSFRGLYGPHYDPSISFPDYASGLDRDEAVIGAIRRFSEVIVPKLVLAPLRGKNLACWCPIGLPCHADVLLELANAPTTTQRSA